MAVAVLLYGCKTWVPVKKHLNRVQASDMRFLRSVKGCIQRDSFNNKDKRQELKCLISKIALRKTDGIGLHE